YTATNTSSPSFPTRRSSDLLLLIGDCSPRLERDESVIAAGVNHVGAEASLQQLAQPPADFQHQILFFEAMWADGARIMSAVSGRSEEHTSELQSLDHLLCRL